MIGYKVVNFHGGVKTSAYSDGEVVTYHLDKWTKRPDMCGPLALFVTLNYARAFARGYHGIFKCEYKRSNEGVLYTPNCHRWAKNCPRGTVFANKVKLIKLVK